MLVQFFREDRDCQADGHGTQNVSPAGPFMSAAVIAAEILPWALLGWRIVAPSFCFSRRIAAKVR